MSNSRRLTAVSLVLGVTATGVAGLAGPTVAARPARVAGWGPAVNLSRAAPLGTLVPTSAAVDARGDMLAVWVNTNGPGHPLMAAYRPSGHRWTTRAVPGSRGARDADVAFDGSGDAVVVWTAGRRVRAIRRTAHDGWATPVTVAQARAGVEPRPPNSVQLAVNPRGRAVALWEGPRTPHAAIGFPDGTWGPGKALFTGGAAGVARRAFHLRGPASSSGDTNLVIDRWGRATVAWSRDGLASQPVVVSRDPGRPWSKPHALAPRSLGNGVQQIAGQRNGDLAVAWQSTVHGRPGIRIARKSRQGRWEQTPPLVHGMNVFKLRIAMDGSGVVTAVWQTERGALWRAEQSPQGTWTRKVRIMPPGTAGDEYGLVANNAGNVLLGSTAPAAAHSVWALRRSPARAWQPHPVTVSRGRGESRGPAVAIGPSGAALVVWAFRPTGSALSHVQASLTR